MFDEFPNKVRTGRGFYTHTMQYEKKNFHHLVVELAWFALALPATTRFLQAYAIRIGVTDAQMGWLASLPAIIMVLSASIGSRWMRRYSNSLSAITIPTFIFRLSFLLAALTPYLPSQYQFAWLTFSLLVPALGQGLSSVIFLILINEAIPAERMAELHSRRTLILNVMQGLSGLALGLWLTKVPFPFNYQAMFIVGFVLALMSMRELYFLKGIPARKPTPASQPKASAWRDRRFWPVAFAAFVTHVTFLTTAGLVNNHLMRNLGATEGFLSIYGVVELSAGALVGLFASRLVGRLGSATFISVSMVVTAMGSFVFAAATSQLITLIAAALMGGGWMAAAGVGINTFMSERLPDGDRSSYTTTFMQMAFAGIILGPMVSTVLLNAQVSLVTVLWIGGSLRLLGGVLIQLFSTFQTEQNRYPTLAAMKTLR